MPLDGEPADVVARVGRYDDWLAASADVPKLLITFQPLFGAMMAPELTKPRKTSPKRSPPPSFPGWTSTTCE